jgi:hypothetical protein
MSIVATIRWISLVVLTALVIVTPTPYAAAADGSSDQITISLWNCSAAGTEQTCNARVSGESRDVTIKWKPVSIGSAPLRDGADLPFAKPSLFRYGKVFYGNDTAYFVWA